uniref:ATP-dependent DNA helicase n=1 Tax=Pseudactinotalea sp. TaxID=1926260 RepID=UPI003B3B4820
PPEEDAALFDMAPESSSSAEEHPAAASSRDDSLGGQVVRVRAWADETDSGDRDDLVPGVSDRAWRQVSVTSMECIGQSCPLRSECFPELARQAARTADVVVTNHAMLGIAASGSPGALPEFDALVVDEAHELPSRVTAQASVELSAPAVERVARLARRQAGTATQALDDAAVLLRSVLTATPEGRWPDALPPEVEGAVRAVADAARQVVSSIKQDSVKSGSKDGDAGGALAQARSAALVLFEITDRLLSDRLRNREDVVWCSRGIGPGEAIKINVAPLDVAGPIAGQLLAGRGAVLTSATLTLGGTFDATAGSMGMGGADYTSLEVASPFDYGRQGIVYVAKHLPKPGREGTDPRVLEEIAELIESAGGRTLGLFSSRRGATAAAEAMRERLRTPVLVQGEDSIPSLVRDFAADPATSLFGTLSLWQGVDVPGDACQLVLIDRIPFPRPDDPVMAARTEVVAKRGGNGFMAVSATHAALLLAQGAGRLIRGVSDRGVVAILDPRVATARYGTFLSRSLPPLWPTTDPAIVRAALRRLRDEQ